VYYIGRYSDKPKGQLYRKLKLQVIVVLNVMTLIVYSDENSVRSRTVRKATEVSVIVLSRFALQNFHIHYILLFGLTSNFISRTFRFIPENYSLRHVALLDWVEVHEGFGGTHCPYLN
jgi:hypothetical protein